MESLNQMISRYVSITKQIRTKLMADIDGIPENAAVTRISTCTFTVRSSEIMKSGLLCAEYYDLAQQKKILKEILSTKETLESQVRKIQSVADTGKLTMRAYSQSYTFIFHPDVVNALKKLLTDFMTEFEVSTTT